MGKFDGILLCSDFDGTLAVKKRISPENCDAIRYFQANGGRFTALSGRTPDFLKEHLQGFEANAPLVGCNGALIKDVQSGALLYEGGRNDSKALDAFEPFWRESEHIKRIFAFDRHAVTYSCARKVSEDAFLTMEELRDHLCFPLYKVVCSVDDGDYAVMLRDALAERLGACFEVSRSCPTYVEVSCIDANKGAAALRLKQMLGAKLLVTAGDYENDISMLRAADIGYAVGNASPEVKAAADRVTVDVGEHAIAAIVNELDKAYKNTSSAESIA